MEGFRYKLKINVLMINVTADERYCYSAFYINLIVIP